MYIKKIHEVKIYKYTKDRVNVCGGVILFSSHPHTRSLSLAPRQILDPPTAVATRKQFPAIPPTAVAPKPVVIKVDSDDKLY
jgi:hypothetical protein